MTFFPADVLGNLTTLDPLLLDTRLFWKLRAFLDWLLIGHLNTSITMLVTLLHRKQIVVESGYGMLMM